jgi:formate-dependent nitrite reductase membrane component NrfD
VSSVVNPFTGRWIMEPKTQNVWGIPHSIWFALMGVGGALFINRAFFGIELTRIFGLSFADVLSFVLIGIGGLILIADLGRPLRVLRALLHPQTSWISIGAIADFTFLVVAGLWMIPDLDVGGSQPLASLPWAGSSPLGTIFQIIAGLAALVVIVYPGLVLAFSPSIPFWNTAIIPLQFLVYAFSSALGLALAFSVAFPVPAETVRIWMGVEALLLGVCLLLQLAHLLNAGYTHTAARVARARLLRGDLTLPFVWGTLVVGLVLPALLLVWGNNQSSLGLPGLLVVAAVFVVVGNWLAKFTVIRAGTYAPFL